MNGNRLEEIIIKTREALLDSGAKSYHMNVFKAFTNKVRSYAEEEGITEYTPELGLTVLRDNYGLDKTAYLYCMNELNDYLAFGAVNPYKGRKPRVYDIPEGFADSLDSYLRYRTDNRICERTLVGDKLYLERFFVFLRKQNVNAPQDVSVKNVFAFIGDLRHYYEDGMVSCNVRTVRLYMKHCFEMGIITSDIYSHIPNIRYCKHSKLPSVYTEEEVKKLLASIDMGSPIGKRDHAIILLIARSGLRAGDVADLRFSDIDWDKQRIHRVQLKTKKAVDIPLLNDVGEAIINYLKNGRPVESASDRIFVIHKPPYTHFSAGNVGNIVSRNMARAGVKNSERKCGSHALRHTLASRLLECSVPMPVISEILGHSDTNMTMTYLRIDIEQLRSCALEVIV